MFCPLSGHWNKQSQQRSNQNHSFENGLPSLSRNFVPIQFYSSAVINIIFSSMYHGLCMFLPATVAGPNVHSVSGWQAVTFLSPFLNIDPWGMCSMPYDRTEVVTTEPSPTNWSSFSCTSSYPGVDIFLQLCVGSEIAMKWRGGKKEGQNTWNIFHPS